MCHVMENQMESAVAVKSETGIAKFNDNVFESISKGGDYFSRLQLMTSNTAECKAGKFPTNHFALVDGKIFTDVGDSVNVFVLAWRPKAIDMSGENVMCVYDPKVDASGMVTDPTFKNIMERSEDANSQCMYGPEYLVYIPHVKKFATLFLGSKSGRRESPNIKSRMGNTCTLKNAMVSNKRFTWCAIVSSGCSLPLDPPAPELAAINIEKFMNPPDVDIEPAAQNSRER